MWLMTLTLTVVLQLTLAPSGNGVIDDFDTSHTCSERQRCDRWLWHIPHLLRVATVWEIANWFLMPSQPWRFYQGETNSDAVDEADSDCHVTAHTCSEWQRRVWWHWRSCYSSGVVDEADTDGRVTAQSCPEWQRSVWWHRRSCYSSGVMWLVKMTLSVIDEVDTDVVLQQRCDWRS